MVSSVYLQETRDSDKKKSLPFLGEKLIFCKAVEDENQFHKGLYFNSFLTYSGAHVLRNVSNESGSIEHGIVGIKLGKMIGSGHQHKTHFSQT